ncbi:hypothetical protein BDL97_09G081400 [Sphagnum fallax]|nr:hypothetical protein BDL97_09G081400 [Sphagnum fallax]
MALCVPVISPSWGTAGAGLHEQLRPKELRASEQKKKKTCKAGRRGERREGVLGFRLVCEASQEDEQERSRGASAAIWQQPPAEIVKILGQKVWGRKLPPGALVAVVREVWSSGWHTMMAQLAPSDEQKGFKRLNSQFRSRPITPAQSGRYHLYAAFTCPWAHRCAIVHVLKGLEDAVPLSIAVPGSTGLWEFKPQKFLDKPEGTLTPTADRATGKRRLVDVYQSQVGGYNGRSTVPMFWDSMENRVVNNESADIIEILNADFNHLARNPGLDLAPPHLKADIDRWNQIIYSNVNNGVYRCGFAQGQSAYNSAVESLFETLDMLDQHLTTSRYLCGDSLTLADIRLFTTLFRFDPVYQILFKCTKQKLAEYHSLDGYMRDIYQVPGVASTCDLPAIMDGYYKVLFPLNPGGICPTVPRCSDSSALLRPHNRQSMLVNIV